MRISSPANERTLLVLDVDRPAEFARRLWDTYGFDWDTERAARGSLVVWPLDDEPLEELEALLREDGIDFRRAEVDLDHFFEPGAIL